MGKEKNFKTLSKNDREKIVALLEAGSSSYADIAKKFKINVGNVNKLAKSMGLHGCTAKKVTTVVTTTEPMVVEPEVVEVAVEAAPVETVAIKKSHKRLTDEEKLLIAEKLEAAMNKEGFTVAKFAEANNVSVYNTKKIITEYNLGATVTTTAPVEDNTEVVEAEAEYEVVEYSAEDKLNMIFEANNIKAAISYPAVIKVGLVEDRHIMPVSKYIYSELTSRDLSDFEALDNIAEDWIVNNIHFDENGIPYSSIELYCTGAVMVNASVIKGCINHKINLTFMHHNPNDGKYYRQDVLTGNPIVNDESSNPILEFFRNGEHGNIFYNCDVDKIDTSFYSINVREYKGYSTNRDTAKKRLSIIIDNLDNAFNIFSDISKHYIENSSDHLDVQLVKMKLSSNKIYFDDSIAFSLINRLRRG